MNGVEGNEHPADEHRRLTAEYYEEARDAKAKPTAASLLSEAYESLRGDPLGYVMFNFPWDTDPTIRKVKLVEPWKSRYDSEFGPDKWACEFLDKLAEEIRDRAFDGTDPVDVIQFSTVSGHGIGKSVMVAWLIKFISDTRPLSKGVVTANTSEQLKTKTWSELGKWHNISLSKDRFTFNSGRGAMSLAFNDKKYSGVWRCDAQTCKIENSESFAGNHAASSTSYFIFDEAGGIHDKIFEVREGGYSDGEPMAFDFGNGTRNVGRFYENCEGEHSKNFIVTKIDSRDVVITNKNDIERKIDTYGVGSDYVKVRVLGQFPATGDTQFISTGAWEEAQKRETWEDPHAPLVIGVDVARFGGDETVIYPRVGYDARTWPIKRYRGLDNMQVAGKVVEMKDMFKSLGMYVDAIFVDGTGLGSGVVDALTHLGHDPIDVNFSTKPTNFKKYKRKGDEIWGNLRDALDKLCVPADNEADGSDLKKQSTSRCYGYTIIGNLIQMEPKRDMKLRGIDSPDITEGLALTFAEEVVSKAERDVDMGAPAFTDHEYDPMKTEEDD